MRKGVLALALFMVLEAAASAQVFETVTFDEAVQRAVKNHPTVQQAAAGILRAESILQQARARYLPTVDATFSTNVIDPSHSFQGRASTRARRQ